jgi:chromosome segregation ATPase
MIARTVSLTIIVKDVPASRSALDAILNRHQGYAAQLTINTPENDARSFNASLRIPAPELAIALAEIRALGRVQSESQSGEEVSQQHADLVARLNNARETEQRLQAILQQRTGKVSEVLEVEEQISNTRGEIERMEAEQKALEHRVDFASLELQLTEEYKARLNPSSTSVGTRMHNALVAGVRNAGRSLLGIVLLFEEYGPVLLLWIVVLGTPAWLLRRRYLRAQNDIQAGR